MPESIIKNDLPKKLSTYGLITMSHIFETYSLDFKPSFLNEILNNPHTFYHNLLQIPLKHLFNGILREHVKDYQIYGQKLFIDFFLTNQRSTLPTNEETEDEDTNKPASQEDLTRESIEKEHNQLLILSESFRKLEVTNDNLINQSQAILINYVSETQETISAAANKIYIKLNMEKNVITKDSIIQLINKTLTTYIFTNEKPFGETVLDWLPLEASLKTELTSDIKEIVSELLSNLNTKNLVLESRLTTFNQETTEKYSQLQTFCSDFHTLIIRSNGLINAIPGYVADPVQKEENLESLYFDELIVDEHVMSEGSHR